MIDGEIWVLAAWWHVDGLNHSAQAVSDVVEKFQVPGCEVPSQYLAAHWYCSGRSFLSMTMITDMGKQVASVLANEK